MGIEPFNYQKRTNIEEHNQIVDKLNEVIDAVNNISPEPSEFEQRIDALELSAINQQNAIEGIHTRDALQDTAIQRTEGNVSALETDVSEIGTRIGTVEGQNLQQDSAIATLGQRVGATEDNVTGLTGKVGGLETETTNLDGRVTDIDGRLTTLAGNYTALGGRVDSIGTEVGQLSTEVGGLETGKVNVAQGTENAGKYLTVGEDGNITLGDVVIPQPVTYKLVKDRTTIGKVPTAPTTVTVNGIEYKRYYGSISVSNINTAVVDIDIAKVVFNDTDAYCGSLYFQKDSNYGPDPDYKTMGDAGIIYDVSIYGSNIWYTIMVPSDLYANVNLTRIYFSYATISLQVV